MGRKVTVSARRSHGGRRLGRAGLLALLVVTLCVGVFASVAGADDESGDVSAAVTEPTPSANNPLADHCGINIALVVDRSQSTSSFNAQYKNAAKTFVNSLVGTPSQIGLVTFNTTASLQSGYKNVSVNDNGLDSLIDGLPSPSGFTNWQDALEVTQASFTSPVPDLVLFITDGEPTRHNGSGTDLGNAITAANSLKAVGSNHPHITGVGVGNVNSANIAQLTGAGAGLAGDPDVLTTSPDTIADTLKALAVDLCGGTVTIHKQVRTGASTIDGTTPALVNGWDFAASGDGAPSGTTGDDGVGTVNLAFDADHLGAHTITESAGLPGYVIESVTCNNSAVDHTATTFDLDVDQSTVTSCTVVNAPSSLGTIGVSKITTHGAGGPFTVHVSGPNTETDVTGSTVGKDSSTSLGEVSGLYPGTYTLDETDMPAGWAFTGVSCSNGTAEGDVATVTVGVGGEVACTYTNDLVPTNLTIVKTATEGANTGSNQALDYTLSVDNAGPADAHVDATVVDALPAGATLVSVDPPAGVTCDTSALPKISCTVPASQLEVSDPAVEIGVSVTVPNGSGSVTNKSLVTSTDDPAPCTVTSDDITCTEPTDNYSQVTNPIVAVAGEEAGTGTAGPTVAAAEATTALAFTGSNDTTTIAGVAALLVLLGALALVVARKRRGNVTE
jgi:uncharacterized repeat protein (TIGR01451 family)